MKLMDYIINFEHDDWIDDSLHDDEWDEGRMNIEEMFGEDVIR